MSESWDQYAQGWDSNEDVILYSQKAFDTLCKLVDLEGLTVMDFGCGTGLLSGKMANQASHIVAIDSSQKMIEVLQAKQLSNVEALALELSAEVIASDSRFHSRFDLIVASSVCAFLSDYQGTLHLLKSLLKPGGMFVQWDWLKADKEAEFGFTKEMITAALSQTGMEVLKVEQSFSLESEHGVMPVLMGVSTKQQ